MPQHLTKRKRKIHTTLHHRVAELTPFTFSYYTIACERHPERNEDSLLIDATGGLVAVFDGVGGSAAGEIASRTAARAARQHWRHQLSQIQRGRKRYSVLEYNENLNLHQTLEHLIQEADELVRTEGAHKAGTDDLATTVAMAALYHHPNNHTYQLVHAHVGDSRIYLLREGESLQRLTNDDGLLAKLVENQMLAEQDALHIDQAMTAEELSETEFTYFRHRGGITQALGGPLAPVIHIDETTIAPGDRVLLCTDGIHDNLTDAEIEDILRNVPRTTAARILVECSLARSHQDRSMTIRAKPDDMSAIVLTCRF
jgi:serine/threonine protein phosphatase PrpC